jgi:hypothetical protein
MLGDGDRIAPVLPEAVPAAPAPRRVGCPPSPSLPTSLATDFF